MDIKVLNKKAVKETLSLIKKQWDADIKLDYSFLQNKEGKIFIINKEFAEFPLEKLRINNIGLYFAQLPKDGIRLSIEGSQLIGPKAKKNVIELNKEQIKQWLKGEEPKTQEKSETYVLIKYKNDFYGTGKIKPLQVMPKTTSFRAEKHILNFIPKGRRLKIT